MTINWPTLSCNMDWASTITYSPKLEIFEMGDGATCRYGVGINNDPGTFNIVYTNMTQGDFATLRDFIKLYKATGKAILIPRWPEDRTGGTTGYFYITQSNITGDYAPNMTVMAQECYTDD